MNVYDASANMAIFLTRETGSCLGVWHGRMKAKDQRAMFGKFLGKGTLTIDGANERLIHTIKVCFGQDFTETFDRRWIEINQNRNPWEC